MNSINYLIHCIIIEIFIWIYGYRFGIVIFDISGKNKKYFAIVLFLKSCVYNVVTMYLSYVGVIEASYKYGILNIFCVIIIFAIYKILTGLEYLKIILGMIIADTLYELTVYIPYLFVYAIANKEYSWNQNFEAKLGAYLFVAILAIVCIGYILEKYIVKKFLKNFVRWKIPFKNLFRLICVIALVWVMYTYSVQEYTTVIWLYAAIHVITMMGILYIASWFYRYRENKKIQIENQQLNYENQVMKEYCETLEQQVEMMEQFQDDIVRHMEEEEELAKDNDDIKEYVEELKESYKEIK